MAPRSLLHLLTAIAAASVLTEAAHAGVYRAPDTTNPLESRIQAVRQGSWQPLLNAEKASQANGEQQISWWANGGGRGWGNGGWPNGGGWSNGVTGGFINW